MTDIMLVDAAHNTAASSGAERNIYTKFARALHAACCYARPAGLLHVSCVWNLET